MSDVENDGYVSDLLRVTIDGEVQITDNIVFKTITGYREIEDRVYTDWDAAEITLIEDDRWRENDQLTQEFQIQHTINDRISYVAGLYFWNEYSATRTFRWTFTEFRTGQLSQTRRDDRAAGLPFTPGNSDVYIGAETSGQAIFGEVNIGLTDRLDLTLGVRYNDEEIESYTIVPTDVQLPALPDTDPVGDVFAGNKQTVGAEDFSSTTPRVSISYDWRDNLMVYASYAEGFGAGGINVNPVLGIVPYGPEELVELRDRHALGLVGRQLALERNRVRLEMGRHPAVAGTARPEQSGLVDSESDHRQRGGRGRERCRGGDAVVDRRSVARRRLGRVPRHGLHESRRRHADSAQHAVRVRAGAQLLGRRAAHGVARGLGPAHLAARLRLDGRLRALARDSLSSDPGSVRPAERARGVRAAGAELAPQRVRHQPDRREVLELGHGLGRVLGRRGHGRPAARGRASVQLFLQ